MLFKNALVYSLLFVSQASLADQCTDLFEATCLNRPPGYAQALSEKMASVVMQAKSLTASRLGSANLEVAYGNYLKTKGFTLKPDLSPAAKNNVLTGSYSVPYLLNGYFQEFANCTDAANKLQDLLKTNDPAVLQVGYEKYKDTGTSHETLSKIYYRQALPHLYTQIKNQCRSVPGATPEICTNSGMYKFRQITINAFRDGSTATVNKYINTYYAELERLRGLASPSAVVNSTDPTVNELKKKVVDLASKVSTASCSQLESAAAQAYPLTYKHFFDNINQAQDTHNYVIDTIYTEERKQNVFMLVTLTKASITDFVENSWGNDSTKREKVELIKTTLGKLSVLWPERLADTSYRKIDNFPLPVLDLEKLSPIEEFWTGVIGSGLEVLTVLNAYYHPTVTIGVFTNPELFTILAPFLELYQDKPYGMLGVIAHEIGHKIGYRVSNVNGHDLRQEYEQLVQCLRSGESIGMRPGQEDEALADWISSNVLANVYSKLPPAEHAAHVASSMEAFCHFFDANRFNDLSQERLEAGHPENSVRVNGIYGANPGVRQLLSCAPSAPKAYVSCSLNGAIP